MAVNGGLARPSAVAVGAALVALYVATVVGTMSFGHHVRPLFEGIGPPPPYRWVHPPPGFASGNASRFVRGAAGLPSRSNCTK